MCIHEKISQGRLRFSRGYNNFLRLLLNGHDVILPLAAGSKLILKEGLYFFIIHLLLKVASFRFVFYNAFSILKTGFMTYLIGIYLDDADPRAGFNFFWGWYALNAICSWIKPSSMGCTLTPMASIFSKAQAVVHFSCERLIKKLPASGSTVSVHHFQKPRSAAVRNGVWADFFCRRRAKASS